MVELTSLGANVRRFFLLTSARELDRVRPLWESLRRESGTTMFQGFPWNRLAADLFREREAPAVLCAESDSGAVIVPAARRPDGTLTLLGEELSDYRDVLAAGDADALLDEAFERLGGEAANFGPALAGSRLARLGAVESVPFCAALFVSPQQLSAEDFAARHSGARRQLSRLLRAGAVVAQQDGAASALLTSIYRRKAEQPCGLQPNLFLDPLRRGFMVAVAAAQCSLCDVFTLELGSSIAAALVTFRDGRTRRFYTVLHEPAFARYSPGIALLYEVTRRTLAEGMTCDYLTGEQPHKLRFATGTLPLVRVRGRSQADALPAAA